MTDDTELKQRIRERAFQIWIDEGQPDGRHREHWEKAEKEIIGEAPQSGAPRPDEPIGEIKYAAARTVDQGGD